MKFRYRRGKTAEDCCNEKMKYLLYSSSNIIRLVSFTLWSRYIHSFRMVLLTHANEQRRPTNTGQLLLTQQYCEDEETLSPAELLIWEGRGDNVKISDALLRLHQPILIWTDAPKELRISDPSVSFSDPTYIILDGTWQEAKKIFRQGPDCLRSIPRISLEPSFKSNYKLRGNFGYISKFASIYTSGIENEIPSVPDADSNLLCTAEVGACLLLQHGHTNRATALLNSLETFQMSFQCYSSKK